MCAVHKSSQSRKIMNLFNISQPLADDLFGWSNVFLIVGAFLVFFGTIGVVWTGGIRERYADERISKNEAETASAKSAAAVANESAASANERTEQLRQTNLEVQRQLERERAERLHLEASIAPRRVSDKQRLSLISALRVASPLQIHFIRLEDQEAFIYASAIVLALQDAHVQLSMETYALVTPPTFGVEITLPNENQKSLAIRAAFEKAGIPAAFSFGDTGTYDARISVGLRPLGHP